MSKSMHLLSNLVSAITVSTTVFIAAVGKLFTAQHSANGDI